MPQHIQPQSLRGMSLEHVAQTVFHSCVAIEAKYEPLEWSASLQKEVSDLQEFLLYNIQHLWDDVCEVMRDVYILREYKGEKKRCRPLYVCKHDLRDHRVLTALIIHDQMRRLEISSSFWYRFGEKVCLGESQIQKLRGIEKLDIINIKLTSKMLEIIGSTCRDLNEIHITLHSTHATLESLSNLLKCRELRILDISFRGWNYEESEPWLLKLLTELPKLKRCEGAMPNFTKLSSVITLEDLYPTIRDANDLKCIIKNTPFVQYLDLCIVTENKTEIQAILVVLANSSLQLSSLHIMGFTNGESLCLLLQLKGRNLTKLFLEFCESSDITIHDINIIGMNCPKLEVLSIVQYSSVSPVRPLETSVTSSPPMFCRLERLLVSPGKRWDIRLLLVILGHAKGLKQIEVNNAIFHGSRDVLGDILGINPLTELESLRFKEPSFTNVIYLLSPDSLEHLLVSCPKLNCLDLSLSLERDVYKYMNDLFTRVQNENLHLSLSFENRPDYSDDSFDSDESDEWEDFEDLVE